MAVIPSASNRFGYGGVSGVGALDSSNSAKAPVESYTKDGIAYLTNSADSYVNALNQGATWAREDKLRAAAEHREDYEMDRIVEAAKRNGINPVLLLDSFAGNTGSAASYSTSASKTSNYDANAKTNNANSASMFGAIIAALALVLAHL